MTLFDLVGTAVSSILTGGATGLLGGAMQLYAEHKKAALDLEVLKVKQAHDLAMRDKDAAISAQEWAGRTRVAQIEGDAAASVAADNAFAAGLLREPERYSSVNSLTTGQNWIFVLLDTFRGAVRPALTLYLCALVTYIWVLVRGLVDKEDLTANDVLEIWKLVVATILYVWTTVTLWWFSTRNKQAPPPTLRA